MDRREFLESFAAGSAVCAVGLSGCATTEKKAEAGCAPCGKVCSACPAMAAGKCGGCRGDASGLKNPECPIRACARVKGVETCAQCPGFVCPKLRAWAEKSEANAAALQRLQESAGQQ